MLKAKPPDYRFCPFCGRPLETMKDDGRTMSHCYSCNWTYYPHVATSAAAIIVRKNRVLMVRRARAPYLNTWMFPAGFARAKYWVLCSEGEPITVYEVVNKPRMAKSRRQR